MDSFKTKKIVINALMTAIVVVFTFIPVKTAGIEITLAMIPIAVGAICFGEKCGLLLGTVCGVCSFLQAAGLIVPSAFGAAIFSISPFFTALTCIPTRMLAGYLCGLSFKLISKKSQNAGFIASSLLCPLFNTVFFMTTLMLCFYNTKFIQDMLTSSGAGNVLTFVIIFVGINGLIELLANFILALPAAKALKIAVKRM